MPKEHKEDNSIDSDRGSSHKSMGKNNDKMQKKTKSKSTASKTKTKSKSKRSPTPSEEICVSREICVDFRDPKLQTLLLLGLFAIMALALWFGFMQGCFNGRQQRRGSW